MSPLTSIRTRTILCVSVGALFGDYAGVNAFSVVGVAAPRKALHLKGVVYDGDDFASYFDEQSNEDLEAEALTQEFYQEIMIRHDLATAMANVDTNLAANTQAARKATGTVLQPQFSTNPRAMNSAGFFNSKQKMKVYSGGRSARSSAVPLPPKPTYGSATQLSVPGIIAVVLLSRYFWVQALVSIGLITLYFLLVAATSNGGAEWLGAGNMDWSSAVNDRMPLIERTTATTTFMDGEDSTSL